MRASLHRNFALEAAVHQAGMYVNLNRKERSLPEELFVPAYCKTLLEALEEVRRRAAMADGMITRYEKCPGGIGLQH